MLYMYRWLRNLLNHILYYQSVSRNVEPRTNVHRFKWPYPINTEKSNFQNNRTVEVVTVLVVIEKIRHQGYYSIKKISRTKKSQ